jgi:hypothetical protein
MALLTVCLVIALMFYLNEKGKAYREEKHILHNYKKRQLQLLAQRQANTPTEEEIKERMRAKREAEYRRELEKQGFNEELITTILPTILNDGK